MMLYVYFLAQLLALVQGNLKRFYEDVIFIGCRNCSTMSIIKLLWFHPLDGHYTSTIKGRRHYSKIMVVGVEIAFSMRQKMFQLGRLEGHH